jgi:hypothetical protein
MHKYRLAPNTPEFRKACLILWKLRPPNLILGLIRIPDKRPKNCM